MKTRVGFVSNSSTSSFVIVTSVENHERILQQCTEYEKAVIKAMTMTREHKLFGRDIVFMEEFTSSDWWTIKELTLDEKWDEFEDENPDVRWTAWDKYVKLIDKSSKEEVFTINVEG